MVINNRNRLLTRGAAWTFVLSAAVFPLSSSRAEFPLGAEVPEFTLKTPDGSTLALQRQQGRVLITHGKEQMEPKVLILHLFQPDCLQCQVQLKALDSVHEQFRKRGVFIAGIGHRGDTEAVRVLAGTLKVTFPLAFGTGSELAKRFEAGDSFAMTDGGGRVRFAQVGYGEGDEKVWKENIEQLLAGKPVSSETIARKRLQLGDRLPLIELPSVASGKTIALTGDGSRLTFRNENGEISHPKIAIGFFSRYWAFSREEMVHLQKFHQQYGKDGVLVFTIAMLPDLQKTRDLTKELGVSYPVFYGHESDLGKRYAFGWPAYIVDAGGVIRHTQVGFEKGDEQKYERVVKDLLDPSRACDVPGIVSGKRPELESGNVPNANPGPRQNLLFYTASSTDAPHRAILPLLFAVKACEKGHDPTIFLAGDGVMLMKSSVAADVKAVGQPAAGELLKRAVALKIPIFVWGGWGKARGVLVEDLKQLNAEFINPEMFVDLLLKADKVVGF